MRSVGLYLLLCLQTAKVAGFSTYSFVRLGRKAGFSSASLRSTFTDVDTKDPTLTALFNFSNVEENAVSNFERIDDAVMGGISLSSMKQNPEEEFARWSGICRLDGGGFCGTRTLPFQSPLQVGEAEGFYLLCRLTSDDEPERRVWKMTTRSERSRSEQLYQAVFQLPKTTDDEWNLVKIKFSDFTQVRGPRVVEGAPKLNATSGIFQVGLSLSKFLISSTVKEIEDFRPGFFELQVKEIGVFVDGNVPAEIEFSGTLEKDVAEKKKPLVLKVLGPIAMVFFSEKRRRRASAMRILVEKRGFSRLQAIRFGVQLRARQKGRLVAVSQALGTLAKESILLVLSSTLRLFLVYPILLLRKVINLFKGPKKAAAKQ
eukprot:scaffold23496_cov188-Cylindrotheca_fusiformis.AAC.6